MEPSKVDTVPDRLDGILRALSELHNKVLKSTEINSNPNYVNTVRKTLENYETVLMLYIDSNGEYIHPSADANVRHTITELRKYLYPPDAYISSQTSRWIHGMFEEAPFTPSLQHIERMKESIPQSREDGTSQT